MLDQQPRLACRPDREPDFIIGTAEHPYMLRWWMIPRNETFNVYYHRILRDDDDRALHDHPWPSFSIMTLGQLREITPEGSRLIRAGECVYRGPDFAHRLELIDGEPCETLFITGPRVRDWGFHCPKGWVHWQDFVAPAEHGQVGRGCGEMDYTCARCRDTGHLDSSHLAIAPCPDCNPDADPCPMAKPPGAPAWG